jgi:hypothetical protein
MGSPTTRAFPEFSFTEEDMKKFVGTLKIAIRRVFTFMPSLIVRSKQRFQKRKAASM